jgi:hypothetical protein
MLNRAQPVHERADWLFKGNPSLIGVRIENGDLVKAAASLDEHAKARGLKIINVARFLHENVDCAFAEGEHV